jgi:flavin reductase (DIM6/NTAB) family NADH-FMN oxidoreductase RutF
MSTDARTFRDTIALFATGVAIVIAEVDDQVHAMTANAITSLSLDPLLVLFCPGKRAQLAQHLARMPRFTINFLREEQQALSTYFAGGWQESAPPPFRFVPSAAGPRLQGALATVGCETERVSEAGDHWVVIGRVTLLHRGVAPHRPLLFFRGKYHAMDFSEGVAAPDLTQVEDEPPHIFYHP